ncbi:hypothetical protein GCM10009799_41130 [Nocardiopsis rhodophaea]|uniref:Uncharacterized protein n=1 Tax=Nocardiopsis rhodophaea TaxID=280238 RepID=A0ABN2TGW7_9ACTN
MGERWLTKPAPGAHVNTAQLGLQWPKHRKGDQELSIYADVNPNPCHTEEKSRGIQARRIANFELQKFDVSMVSHVAIQSAIHSYLQSFSTPKVMPNPENL